MGACNADELGADGYPIDCSNGTKDVDEPDVDCGGACRKCGAGLACTTNADCASGVCFEAICAAQPSQPTIMSFTASKTKTSVGFPVKLQAVFEGGIGTIEPGIGAVENGATVTTPPLTANTTFTLTVKKDDLFDTKKIDIVTVEAPKIQSFASAVPAVRANTQGTTLTAVFSGGKGVVDQGIGEVKSGETRSTGILAQTKKYTLTVTNDADDKVTSSVEVEAAVTPAIESFTAPASVVSRFRPLTLSASFLGGKGKIDQGVGDVISGLAIKTPEVPRLGATYTLTVTNGLGEKVTASVAVTTKKEIYVTDYNADVLVFDIDDVGDVTPKRIITTPVNDQGILGMAIENDVLYVANENPATSITSYDINEGFRPPYSDCKDFPAADCFDKVKRRIMGPATTINGAYQLAVSNGEIFLADKSSVIKVWNVTADGNVPPKRTLSGGIDNALAVAVSAGELYVANNSGASTNGRITVYPVGASGAAAPTRSFPPIPSAVALDPTGITVSGNEVFVMSKIGVMTVFDKNTGAQLRQLTGPNVKIAESYQCTVGDNLLVCPDYPNNATRVFPFNASGNVAPLRSIGGNATYMAATGAALVY